MAASPRQSVNLRIEPKTDLWKTGRFGPIPIMDDEESVTLPITLERRSIIKKPTGEGSPGRSASNSEPSGAMLVIEGGITCSDPCSWDGARRASSTS